MKTIQLLLVVFTLISSLIADENRYQPDWESLDSRPVPEWFSEARFGIFIHWGPYSVPAWSPKGTYSEWYQYWLQNKTLFGNGEFTGTEVADYHAKTYGPHFSYYHFGEMLTADLFRPEDWVKLFEKAGAKYIVITTKHHDGFCLWPSKEANDRGFSWNSCDIGARRDLIGELTEAVKKTDIKLGFYYSLYEWYHPWWQGDRKRFVDEHFHPQFKNLIESYQPDLIWGDGEWEMSSEDWKSRNLLAWLFNESSVKSKIVLNDRWGSETRKKHGGYYTTEFEAGSKFDKPWEECRGMGFSFGYNRNEDLEDYNSPQSLVLMLVDITSNGGNLLLDIGPDHRGRIPVIMQERLIQMGKWLKINGEAIYGTKPWIKPCQWTDGKQNIDSKNHYISGDFILKTTVHPDHGYARKEVIFTSRGGDIYAICPVYPKEELVIKGLTLPENGQIKFLATQQQPEWYNKEGHLHIRMPQFVPEILKDEQAYAYVFKISGLREYTTVPRIEVYYKDISQKPVISLFTEDENSKIFYTLNGATPDTGSLAYHAPFTLEQSATIKFRALNQDKNPSIIGDKTIKVIDEFVEFRLVYPADKKYAANGAVTLCDGEFGDSDFASGKYLGFNGQDLVAEIKLKNNKLINSVSVSCLQKPASWIMFPKEFEIYKSNDYENFEFVRKLDIEDYGHQDLRKKFILEIPVQSAGAIRIFVKNHGILPEWHVGKGEKAWLFVDEIEVK
ncbi:MAG: alpha-L-fucosidase [Candidatus Marinimicrobia bacterium]|nr:alpha-L-fucosidase [Candidatus Neomarinimicrobiota bacterium]